MFNVDACRASLRAPAPLLPVLNLGHFQASGFGKQLALICQEVTMKKTVIIVFGLLLLGFGLDAQISSPYAAFEFGFDSMAPYLQGFNGRLYYWIHPAQGLYYVAVGHKIFIIPHHQFHRLRGFIKFQMLNLRDFIHYTCMGMSYEENYLRFQFYNNYFNRYRYNKGKFRYLAERYRDYRRNQQRSKKLNRYNRQQNYNGRGNRLNNQQRFNSRRTSRIGSLAARAKYNRNRHGSKN